MTDDERDEPGDIASQLEVLADRVRALGDADSSDVIRGLCFDDLATELGERMTLDDKSKRPTNKDLHALAVYVDLGRALTAPLKAALEAWEGPPEPDEEGGFTHTERNRAALEEYLEKVWRESIEHGPYVEAALAIAASWKYDGRDEWVAEARAYLREQFFNDADNEIDEYVWSAATQ